MTYDQGVRLATRSIALYLVLWAISDLLAMPREFFTMVEALRALDKSTNSAVGYDSHAYHANVLRDELGFLFSNVIRIGTWLLAAGWFYRCSPWLQRYFAEDPQDPLSS